MRVAIGLKARTGRAILIAVSDSRPAQVLERCELRLLPDGDFAPYHAAEGLPPQAAQQCVDRSIAAARHLAEHGIRSALEELSQAGNEICACGILVGPGMPPWTTAEIVAVHVRMHQAEGELFRDVLVHGARACGLQADTLPEKTALDAAASRLGLRRSELELRLKLLGKIVGPPWGKDQKEAAAAALWALSKPASSPSLSSLEMS
jgi:hypothetical protein